jgi:trans-aconitate 2-methyltransferase
MTATWNPAQYEKFKTQRAKPFYDLLNLISPEPFANAVDLGCGTGGLTREAFDRFAIKELLGVDSSREMLGKATAFVTHGLRFELGEIEGYRPAAPLDLLLSNAALQWVAHHEKVFPRLLGFVRPGGQLAIQVPFNFDHPSHVLAAKIAREMFPEAFATPAREPSTLPVERYAEILYANGFAEHIARVEVYGHPLPSGNDVVEWTKGTTLTAYQARLSDTQFAALVSAYRRALVGIIGEGPYFYPFKRILLWGRKG